MAEEKDIALLADNDIIVEIEVQEAPTVVIETTSTTTAEISGDSALGIVVGALPTLAKEATLIAKVAELKEALNSIDFTAIEQAIQGVEDVTAKEATLIQGVEDIIKAVENIDFTDLENSIAEVKNAVANIDFSALAQENTLTQGIQAVKDAIAAIPATDLTPLEQAVAETTKEATLNSAKDEIIKAVNNAKPEIDLTGVAKQGGNPEATNSKILEEIGNMATALTALNDTLGTL